MKERVFVDTNIFIYAAIDDVVNADKRIRSIRLIKLPGEAIVVSTQVINEFYVILLRNGFSDQDIQERALEIIEDTQVMSISVDTIKLAWDIRDRYKYSYWDCLIVASALESGCSTLYTEDMHDGHIIDDRLKIMNPFNKL